MSNRPNTRNDLKNSKTTLLMTGEEHADAGQVHRPSGKRPRGGPRQRWLGRANLRFGTHENDENRKRTGQWKVKERTRVSGKKPHARPAVRFTGLWFSFFSRVIRFNRSEVYGAEKKCA